jgi:hypothetical protein
MGMTLDKAIDIMENYEEYGFLSQENGRNKAINIMHKYQKIQEIINNTDYIEEDVIRYKMICGVVKDGNVD